MKKLNISSQLLLLFVSIILVASIAFSIITLTTINSVADDEVYSRLSTYSYILNSDNYRGPYNPQADNLINNFHDMKIGYQIQRVDPMSGNVFNKPENTNVFISQDEISDLMNEIIKSNEGKYNDYYSKGKIKTSIKPTIYYVAQIRGNGTDINTLNYTIMFTDADYTINLVRSVSLRLIAIFFVLVFLAILVIYLWSNHFVKRIRNIQYHIINMPKNKYEEKYVDSSSDEIGVLSKSVEMMREEISHNEETKQEMLQNLSHDFKTPIAVIKSYAEAIQDGVESKDALKIIIEQADNLRNKVNRLLQYNSLEYLTKDKEFEDVNMYELINEVVLSYKYQTNINFILDLEEGIIFKGYRENWSTVISNIVDNAKRFAKTEIKIILRESRIRIYNDGDPIDEQFLNSVFKPYEKGSKGEFGLGMSIVMKTVDFFGMNLSVRNEEYGGVSFIISKEKEEDNENS